MATAVRSNNPTALPTQMDEDAILREHDAAEQRAIAELESAAPEALDTSWGRALVGGVARPRFARVESSLVSTADTPLIAQLANEIEEHAALFAVRFVELLRRVEALERDRIRLDVAEKCVDAITERLNGQAYDPDQPFTTPTRSIDDMRGRMLEIDPTLAGLCMEAR